MERDNQKPIRMHQGFWTRDQVARDVDSVYVFGDNLMDARQLYVPSQTQAVIRGLDNAIGFPTKVTRFNHERAYLNDQWFDQITYIWDLKIGLLKHMLELGKTIVFPQDGIGTGKAMLKEKAPLCWAYLCKRLKEEFNYDNGQL